MKPTQSMDFRRLSEGTVIPSEGYCDQPYVVKAADGAWVVTMTTGSGKEGDPGQHIITFRSHDLGLTWGEKAEVEPADGPEASYSVLYRAKNGRLYVFYNFNTDRVSEVKREDGGVYARVDSLGDYVFKFSDDHGKSWSSKRYPVPMREFACDRENIYGGNLKLFWNVGRPLRMKDGSVLLVMHKVGAMGKGFFAQSEGAFLKSPNLDTEEDPSRILFSTLPEGDIGLRTPPGGGRVAEEQSVVEMATGRLHCIYRTVDGYPAVSQSDDGGKNWTEPAYATYRPGARRIKHPRAANFIWKCSNGKYVYWFHNHGGKGYGEGATDGAPYADRNPAWVCGGVEREGILHWSEPEILLYDETDPFTRMSYPDFIEEDGQYWITETQKTVARIHPIPPAFLEGLWSQFDAPKLLPSKPHLQVAAVTTAQVLPMPPLSPFRRHPMRGAPREVGTGTALLFEITLPKNPKEAILFDNRDQAGKGFQVTWTVDGELRLDLSDGRCPCFWTADRGSLRPGKRHQVGIIVDSRPGILLFVVDGMLQDGGDTRQFGWGRMNRDLLGIEGADLRIHPMEGGAIHSVSVYDEALRVSDVVNHQRARMA